MYLIYRVLMECESMLWFMLERKTAAYKVGIFLLVLMLSPEGTCISPLLSADVCGFHFPVHSLLVEDSKLSQAVSSAFQASRQFGIHRAYLGLKLGGLGDIEIIWRG